MMKKLKFILITVVTILLFVNLGLASDEYTLDNYINNIMPKYTDPKNDPTLPSLLYDSDKEFVPTYFYYYYKDKLNSKDLKKDITDCSLIISQGIARFGYGGKYVMSSDANTVGAYFSIAAIIFNGCMEEKGYVRKVHINPNHHDIYEDDEGKDR